MKVGSHLKSPQNIVLDRMPIVYLACVSHILSDDSWLVGNILPPKDEFVARTSDVFCKTVRRHASIYEAGSSRSINIVDLIRIKI